MTAPRPVPHPLLGFVRQVAWERLCSACGVELLEDFVPLVIYAENSDDAWMYCRACGERTFLGLRDGQ